MLRGVSWATYRRLAKARGDGQGPKLTYLEGKLELMSPSIDHEAIEKLCARLLEAWAEEREVSLNGYGSWTLESEDAARALEPDECYALGTTRPERPDSALEVLWTRRL